MLPLMAFVKHIGATFFSLYAPYGRPELAPATVKATNPYTQESQLAALQLLIYRNAKRPHRPMCLSKRAMPSDWHRFFEGKFHGFSISHQHSIETFYESALESLPALCGQIGGVQRVSSICSISCCS